MYKIDTGKHNMRHLLRSSSEHKEGEVRSEPLPSTPSSLLRDRAPVISLWTCLFLVNWARDTLLVSQREHDILDNNYSVEMLSGYYLFEFSHSEQRMQADFTIPFLLFGLNHIVWITITQLRTIARKFSMRESSAADILGDTIFWSFPSDSMFQFSIAHRTLRFPFFPIKWRGISIGNEAK